MTLFVDLLADLHTLEKVMGLTRLVRIFGGPMVYGLTWS